jgi:hypothetical protein
MDKIGIYLNVSPLTKGEYLFSMGGRNFASFFLVTKLRKFLNVSLPQFVSFPYPYCHPHHIYVIPAEAGIQSENSESGSPHSRG